MIYNLEERRQEAVKPAAGSAGGGKRQSQALFQISPVHRGDMVVYADVHFRLARIVARDNGNGGFDHKPCSLLPPVVEAECCKTRLD